MTDVNLILFGMPKDLSLINEIARYYSGAKGINVESIDSMEEAIQYINAQGNALFLFKIENKKDLTDAVGVLKTQKRKIKQGLLKSASLSFVTNQKVEKILTKYGCVDQLDPTITAKTLSFKIDFWTRALATIIKNEEANEHLRKQKEAMAAQKDKKINEFVIGPSLLLRSDIWILKSENDYKKIIKRWLVKFLGPSTTVGQWIELEKQPGDKESTWRYIIKNKEDNIFILEDGAWFFYGDKPEFDWNEQRWSFTGDTPHLYFYSREGNVYSRIKYAKGKLLIAENSEFALTKETDILSSCESNLAFKRKNAGAELEEDEENDEDVDFNNPNAMLDRLDQKNKTDEDEVSSLESKNNINKEVGKLARLDDYEDELTRRSLEDNDNPKNPFRSRDRVEEIERGGNLQGRSSTDRLDNNPLIGKGKTDHLDHGHLVGDSYTDDLGSNKKRAKYDIEDLNRDPLSGKASTDQLSRKQELKSQTENLGPKNLSSKISPEELKRDSVKIQKRLDPYEGSIPRKRQEEFDDLYDRPKDKLNAKELGRAPLEYEEALARRKDRKDQVEYDGPGRKRRSGELRRDELEFDEDTPELRKNREEETEYGGPGRKRRSGELRRDELEFDEDTPELRKNREEETEYGGPGRKRRSGELRRDELEFDEDTPELRKNREEETEYGGPGRKRRSGELRRDELEFDEDTPELRRNNEDQSENLAPGRTVGIDELSRDSLDFDEDFDDDLGDTFNDEDDFIHKPRGLDQEPKKQDELFAKTNNLNSPRHDLDRENSMIGTLGEHQVGSLPKEVPKSRDELLDMKDTTIDSPFGKKNASNILEYNFDNDYNRLGEEKPKALREIEEELRDPFQDEALNNPQEMPGFSPELEIEQKESEMLELLGGGLTDGSDQLNKEVESTVRPDNVVELKPLKQVVELPTQREPIIKDDGLELNLESGEMRVVLRQESKSGNMLTFLCKFDDIFEDELVVTAPKDSVNSKVKVLINLSLTYDKQQVNIDSEGKVVDVEPSDDGPWDILTVKLIQWDQKAFNNLMALYAKRQERIHDFMKRAKGY